jgi:hypothetical protein
MEYESVTQKVLLFVESVLQNSKQLQLARLSYFVSSFYFAVSGLKIVGHGNADNNLESLCISDEERKNVYNSCIESIVLNSPPGRSRKKWKNNLILKWCWITKSGVLERDWTGSGSCRIAGFSIFGLCYHTNTKNLLVKKQQNVFWDAVKHRVGYFLWQY